MNVQALTQFRTVHRGDVITPDDGRYEQARRVWNAMIDKRPAVIARPREAADVIEAMRFAQSQNLPIAIRGGAHSIAGRGTCDDGMVIDFCDMKAVRVDPAAKTAVAEAGAKWQDLDRETQAHGLATTGGTVGDTGIAGLTLGGGFGWLEGRFGMTVDNLLAADVVLASGKLVRASATEHPDLFWALRGGGGNFGIVTSFTYRLHEVGPLVIGGLVIHPFARAAEVLAFYNEFMRTAPDELVAAAVLMTGPDGNKACAIAVCYSGNVRMGEKIVAPLKSFGPPVMDMIGPMPSRRSRGCSNRRCRRTCLNYWKAEFVNELSRRLIVTAVGRLRQGCVADLVAALFPIRGAASRVAVEATAFPHRSGFHTGIYSLWKDPADERRQYRVGPADVESAAAVHCRRRLRQRAGRG